MTNQGSAEWRGVDMLREPLVVAALGLLVLVVSLQS
jgi:hypothetical protein